MRDLKNEGKDNKPEIKTAGSQDNNRTNKQGGTGAYNPQQKQTDKTQQNPLPGKGGQNIGQGGLGGGGINRDQRDQRGTTGGKVDFNKDKGSWK